MNKTPAEIRDEVAKEKGDIDNFDDLLHAYYDGDGIGRQDIIDVVDEADKRYAKQFKAEPIEHKSSMVEWLKDYLANTPIDQVRKEWDEACKESGFPQEAPTPEISAEEARESLSDGDT